MSKLVPKSRPKRWQEAWLAVDEAFGLLRSKLEELDEIRQEYEEWRDNLPESLQSSPLGDKLDTVADFDLLSCLDEVEITIQDADEMDLPLGFGRD
jgi:hypothetical protein